MKKILLPFSLIFSLNISAQTMLISRIIYSNNQVVTLQYIKSTVIDSVHYNENLYLISKSFSNNEKTILISILQNGDTLYKYQIEKRAYNIWDVCKYSFNDNDVCRTVKSKIYFNSNVDSFFHQIDYIFLSNLTKYTSFLPDACETNNFPENELFSFISEKRFGNLYRKVTSENDSIFSRDENKLKFSDFRKYKVYEGITHNAFGFYPNSFGEIRKDIIQVIKARISKRLNKIKVIGENKIENDRYVNKYHNYLPISKVTKSKSKFKTYTTSAFYMYPNDFECRVVEFIDNKKFREIIHIVNL